MCGLFGMTLPRHYPTDLIDRADAIALLGYLAEERGQDSSGVAVRVADPARRDETWQVSKTLGPFRRLSARTRLMTQLGVAQTVIGHTRWATQGRVELANASPLAVGTLLATHNGDVDPDTVPHRQPVTSDSTDSEVLFSALATAHRDRVSTARLVQILTLTRGRSAMAWTDTARRGGRVWLARAGLSPLAVGQDVDGGLWWASNPDWLRQLSRELALPFRRLTLVEEGTLLSATPMATQVRLVEHASFKPTVRARDARLLDIAVWRGFSQRDRASDRVLLRHRVAQPAVPETTGLLPLPTLRWPASGAGVRGC
jgi:glucosamine--fructose-6-phosphate aminotransferase (isomerizing)